MLVFQHKIRYVLWCESCQSYDAGGRASSQNCGYFAPRVQNIRVGTSLLTPYSRCALRTHGSQRFATLHCSPTQEDTQSSRPHLSFESHHTTHKQKKTLYSGTVFSFVAEGVGTSLLALPRQARYRCARKTTRSYGIPPRGNYRFPDPLQ